MGVIELENLLIQWVLQEVIIIKRNSNVYIIFINLTIWPFIYNVLIQLYCV